VEKGAEERRKEPNHTTRESKVIYSILNTLCIYPNPLRGTIPLPPHQCDVNTEKRREEEDRFST
jgi:hypothetical protein